MPKRNLPVRIGEAGNFHWTGLSNLTPEDLLAARPTGAGLPKRKFAAQWLRDCLQPGSQTQGSIEIAAERDGVCITTLRRAKFDIGVRAPKTENQVPGGGLCPLRRMTSLRSTRQDAQINYLSTLSIFMKQTTYLATLPNPKIRGKRMCLRGRRAEYRFPRNRLRRYRRGISRWSLILVPNRTCFEQAPEHSPWLG